MTRLVTGAGGFVGLNILEHCLAKGEAVTALTDKPLFPPAAAAFATLPGALDVVIADVRRPAEVAAAFSRRRIDSVIHCAAITLGPASRLATAERAIDVNLIGTQHVLAAAQTAGVRRFVYPSSSAVYGPAPFEGAPVSEAAQTRPAGVYGFTKLASERLLLAAQADGLMDVAIGRVTAVFGAWEHDTGVRETLSPPFQLARLALAGTSARMPEGGARDWTSARDVAAALIALADANSLAERVFNISLGETWHPARLATALAHRLGGDANGSNAPEGDINVAFNDDVSATRSPINADLIAERLGVRFMAPEDAVADYADWLIANGRDALG